MKTNFLVIEDDPIISNTIKFILESNNGVVIGIAKDFETAVGFLNSKKPDVCLIDINLKGEFDGIDFAMELDKIQIPYFYLTAQTDHLTIEKVHKTNPLGYIVKPFTKAGLWSSISVVWQKHLNEKEKIFTIKSDGYIYKIPENDILFLEAFDNYCYVHSENKKILVPHTLKKVKSQLQGNHFFSPHRSYYVNTKKITDIGLTTIHLNSISISLSKAKRPELLKIIENNS